MENAKGLECAENEAIVKPYLSSDAGWIQFLDLSPARVK